MSQRTLPLLLGLLITFSCGRTDFDHNYIPDAGTDAASDADASPDAEGCGNGILESALGEHCDNGDANSDLPNANCRTDCTFARCGDGITDTLTEECDDGDANSDLPGAACRSGCLLAGCGDGILDPGEECDQGGLNSDEPGAVCRSTCTLPGCGDGIVDPITEECDDGNAVDSDGCTNLCTVATCGDGVVQAGVETCDDGNTVDDLSCSADCLHYCGDGVVDPSLGESCDDGALNSDTTPWACRSTCKPASCGDGVADPLQFCLHTPGYLDCGGAPVEALAVDLDGDEINDLVLVSANAIHVYLKRGLGYDLAWSSSGLTAPISPMVADFNADGLPDLAVVESTAKRVAVFRATGAAPLTWSSPIRTSLGGSVNAGRAVTGQFSSDGLEDIAVLIPYSNTLKILSNNGSGGFSTANQTTCTRPVAIGRGGFGTSAHDDIAVICNTQDLVEIFGNLGDGSFSTSYLSAASSPVDLRVADMDGDGLEDIVVLKSMSSPSTPELTVYYQSSAGTFSPGTTIGNLATGASWFQVGTTNALAPIRDLLVSEAGGFTHYLNLANRTFMTGSHISWNTAPGKILWADLDGDGVDDYVLPGGVSTGFSFVADTISLPLPTQHPLPTTARTGVVADFTADGNNDAILVAYSGKLLIASGDGSGHLSSVTARDLPGLWGVGVVGDSAAPDLAAIVEGGGASTLVANPTGLMSGDMSLPSPGSIPVQILSGTFLNGDLSMDAAILYQDSAVLQVILGGSTPTTVNYPVGSAPSLLADGLVDGDASRDFLVLDGNGTSLYTLLNNGSGAFTAGFVGSLPFASPDAMALVDIDGDGHGELVASYGTEGLLRVYAVDVNAPSISLVDTISVDCDPAQLLRTDHDNSFGQDLILLCSGGSRLIWLASTSTVLSPSTLERVSLWPLDSCAAGDMDDDGTDDLVCPSTAGNLNIIRTLH